MGKQLLIQCEEVGIVFDDAESPLLENTSLTIKPGITCIVGMNGSGKSVLAALLAQQRQPSAGRVTVSGEVGYLSQINDEYKELDKNTTVANLLGYTELSSAMERIQQGECNEEDLECLDENWDFESRFLSELARVGFDDGVLERSFNSLSGGEQTKLRLSKLAIQGCDIFVLDEPSNHLDSQGREQLLQWMRGAEMVLLVTHDRSLLEAADEIIEVEQGNVTHIRAGWDDYVQSKLLRLSELEHKESVLDRELKQAKKKQIEAREKQAKQSNKGKRDRRSANQSKLILDKAKETSQQTQGKKAKKSESAIRESRQKLHEVKEQKVLIDPLSFQMEENSRETGLLLQAIDVKLPYVQQAELSFSVLGGEKLAIRGANGSGKSTLLKVISGELEVASGTINTKTKLKYLDQHFSLLDRETSALANFERLCPGYTQTEYRNILAKLRIRKEKALYPLIQLSIGECLKVAMACVFSDKQSPGLLLLDEPDNHLDLDSKQLLEKALKEYRGSFLLVSHDPYFIRNSGVTRCVDLF